MKKNKVTTPARSKPRPRSGAPSRRDAQARVERIIEAAIGLLAAHQLNDISMSQIADAAGISRTTIYGFFPTTFSIFEVISRRYIAESSAFVLRTAKERKPSGLEEVLDSVVDATVVYFNKTPPACKTLLAAGGLQVQVLEKDYDILCASIFHELFDTPWPIKKLSEQDPFRTLSVAWSAMYVASITRHGRITPFIADQAKLLAKSYFAGFLQSLAVENPAKKRNFPITALRAPPGTRARSYLD